MAIALPTEKTKPKVSLEDYIIFLYGSPKIGKTTFCSQFDEPLFLATEEGTNALSVYKVTITSWEDFLDACAAINKGIASGEFKFKTLVIDTVDNLIKFCTDYVLKREGVAHEGDLGFGKGYTFVKDEFRRVLVKLSLLPVGLVMISHEKTEEITTRTNKFNKAVPTLSKSHREIVLGMADLILYAHNVQKTTDEGVKDVRVLRTKASEYWEAGERPNILPPAIEFSHASFMKAWNDGMKNFIPNEKKEGKK